MSLNKGLAIVHGNKLESLVEVVEHWIREHPLSPLENETFLIYNNGVGQWLKQHLAQNGKDKLGIAAGLEVKLPSQFVWEIYRAVLGENIPKDQPLAKKPLTWRLYRLLPELIKKDEFENLAHFLADDENEIKRHQLAEQLADLFDQYQMYRADWLLDWEKGDDKIRDAHNEKTKEVFSLPDLPTEQMWQAKLWREILNDMSEEEKKNASRSSVHDLFIKEIENFTAENPPKNLPPRIIVFGIPTLAQQHIEVLAKISLFCEVILFITNPCQHYWADIIEDKELLKAENRRQKKKPNMENVSLTDEDLHLYANPLLAAWGKQGRDYIRLLDQFDERNVFQKWNWAEDKIDLFLPYGTLGDEKSCLLHQLQQTILDLEPTPKEEKFKLTQPDNSIAFHIAHSPQREVEILHDQLLDLFNKNADGNGKSELKPREILVMVPDINKYAPHIHAVFGQIQSDDKRFIPYSVTDQQERGHNSLVVATEFLLSLPNSRFTVSQIRWLLEIPAIRNRFDIEESSVPKLCQWIEGAQIRWGLNAEHRKEFGINEGLEANTWKFGLNRMLLGYAVGNGEAFNDIEPYEEIGGLEAQTLGGLCQLMDLLENYAKEFNQDWDYKKWVTLLNKLLTDFFSPDDEKESKTLESLKSALKKWEDNCKNANLENSKLSRNVVCDSWLSGVDEASFQKIFLSGKVNFCTLMPMRSIPFKVICVLGMNDGEFPRQKPQQSFDLMSLPKQYRPGDRSRRQDDQYVFLEALLSARQHFYVSWVGKNVRDNSEIPPSVLISQLREAIERTWELADENKTLLKEITLEHPLQPFSKLYLENRKKPQRLFTYSSEWFVKNSEQKTSPKLTQENEKTLKVELETLGLFLKNPVKTYCNKTLNFYFNNDSKISEDDEPFNFNGLEQYKFKDDLLSDLKNTQPSPTFFDDKKAKLKRKGQFPLGSFAELSFAEISEPVQQAWGRYNAHLASWNVVCDPLSIDMSFIENGTIVQLSGDVQNVRKNANGKFAIIALTPQSLIRLKPQRQIKYHNLFQHWIKHLALCATLDNFEKSCICAADVDIELQKIEKSEAEAYLKTIVSAWYQNRTEVLPIAIKSVFASLENSAQPDLKAAKEEYEDKYENEDMGIKPEVESDLYLKRIFPTFKDLVPNDKGSEFEKWATELYLPIKNNAKEA